MNTPADFDTLRRQHLEWLDARNYSARTISDRDHWLRHFINWLPRQAHPQLDRATLEAYAHSWAVHRKADGQPLSPHTKRVRMVPPKSFCRWLARHGHLASDPTVGLESPRLMQSLPKSIFSHAETEKVIRLPNVGRRNGLRDRAILEVLYSTGIRRTELTQLKIPDVDQARGLIMVRRGKGGKDRLVPLGRRAVHWVQRYLAEWRPRHVRDHTNLETLFLTERGGGIAPRHLTGLVGQYVRRADLHKAGSCHVFRHTMATLMLENGADIRHLQEQLGHASLQTTQIYTKVSVRHLQKVHAATHPAEIAHRRALNRQKVDSKQSPPPRA